MSEQALNPGVQRGPGIEVLAALAKLKPAGKPGTRRPNAKVRYRSADHGSEIEHYIDEQIARAFKLHSQTGD